MILKPLNSSLVILLSLFVLSCGSKNSPSVEEDVFLAYAKYKGISKDNEKLYERARNEFLQKTQLSNTMLETEVLDSTLIDAQVAAFKNQLVISSYFEQYLQKSVTPQSIKNFYTTNVDNYTSNKVQISHILFRVSPKMSEQERQVLLTKAHEAYSQIKSGSDFALIAKQVSEDKVSGEKGGDLGWIQEGAISKEFSNIAFSLQEGEVAEPFLTSFGFHIIKATSSPQEVIQPLQAVEGDIRYQLRSQAKSAEIKRLLEQ